MTRRRGECHELEAVACGRARRACSRRCCRCCRALRRASRRRHRSSAVRAGRPVRRAQAVDSVEDATVARQQPAAVLEAARRLKGCSRRGRRLTGRTPPATPSSAAPGSRPRTPPRQRRPPCGAAKPSQVFPGSPTGQACAGRGSGLQRRQLGRRDQHDQIQQELLAVVHQLQPREADGGRHQHGGEARRRWPRPSVRLAQGRRPPRAIQRATTAPVARRNTASPAASEVNRHAAGAPSAATYAARAAPRRQPAKPAHSQAPAKTATTATAAAGGIADTAMTTTRSAARHPLPSPQPPATGGQPVACPSAECALELGFVEIRPQAIAVVKAVREVPEQEAMRCSAGANEEIRVRRPPSASSRAKSLSPMAAGSIAPAAAAAASLRAAPCPAAAVRQRDVQGHAGVAGRRASAPATLSRRCGLSVARSPMYLSRMPFPGVRRPRGPSPRRTAP